MNDWHRLGKSFADLSKRHPFLENTLSADPRLEAVEAGISLSTLTLKPRGSVHWVAVATRGTRYTVAIMDALESAERDVVQCSAEKVVFTILDYLEKLKR